MRGAPPISRHSRDPRPVGDRGFAGQCARNVVQLLGSRGYGKMISHEKLLKDPSTKEFFDIFRYLVAQLDPQLEVEGKMEDEVPVIMRRLKYPVEVNRSKLQAISGPNTWPQLLAVLDWLVVLVRINDDVIEPVAACHLGLMDLSDPERDGGDHHVLRSLHENYLHYLNGKDDQSDEARLRQIYEERISALRGEIERLHAQHAEMERRAADFRAEHERLLELRKAPLQLELEADRLRTAIQQMEQRVQRAEEEAAATEAGDRQRARELEDLRTSVRQLTAQVECQAYSKRDIERLKCERGHLHHLLQDLQAESEKAEHDVWELGMQESSRAEEIGRLMRQANELTETLEHGLEHEVGLQTQDLLQRLDLSEPSDALAALDFKEVRGAVQGSTLAHQDAAVYEENCMHEVYEEARAVQEELSEKDRECRRLKLRLEQLNRMREEYRDWSAKQLDEAQSTTEATEDAVHAMAIGGAAPSLRDAAEVDKLRLLLNGIRTQGANEQAQLQEQIRRDEERLEEHRHQCVLRELEAYVRTAEAFFEDVKAAVEEPATAARPSLASRGGS